MRTDVTIRLQWDESFPGWAATAEGFAARGDEGVSTGAIKIGASSNPSPLATVADAIDRVARQLDVHPANIDYVTIQASGAEWLEAARRAAR